MWGQLLLLALAGAAGTLTRYGLATWVQRWAGPAFPWGTLAVNLVGCLLFGLVVALSEGRALVGPQARLILLTGFMGALTTFSTFAFDTTQLASHAGWTLALVNVAAQNVLGLASVYAGLALGQRL